MGTIVQRDLGYPAETREVYYNGAGGALAVGYAVCYDPAEDLTHAAGEFAELERFKVVAKPATLNLAYFAGIVVDILHKTSGEAGFVRIAIPRRGTKVNAYCSANAVMTDPPTALRPTDGQWYLVADASTDIASDFSRRTVAIAGETKNTSGTPGNAVVFGVL